MASAPKPNTDHTPEDREQELDKGLKDTFPASDPVSATQTTRTGSPKEFAKPKPGNDTSNAAQEEDEMLDEALKETFPASDPPAVTSTTHAGKPAKPKD